MKIQMGTLPRRFVLAQRRACALIESALCLTKCNSESQGHGMRRCFADGRIEAMIMLKNVHECALTKKAC
jgi:hypothetical protein